MFSVKEYYHACSDPLSENKLVGNILGFYYLTRNLIAYGMDTFELIRILGFNLPPSLFLSIVVYNKNQTIVITRIAAFVRDLIHKSEEVVHCI